MKKIIIGVWLMVLSNTVFAQNVKDINVYEERISNWIDCEECDANELENLLKIGKEVTPFLITLLENGPSKNMRFEYTYILKNTYKNISNYSDNHNSQKNNITEKKYVEMYLNSYINNVVIKSALALKKINTIESLNALKTASKSNKYNKDIIRVITNLIKY